MEKSMAKVADKLAEKGLLNPRYERKFVLEGFYLEDIMNKVVLSNSFAFQEIFYARSVNNIYYDDGNYSFYKENVSGDGLRKKYRLRWYGEDFSVITKPTLEIKKKYGEVGDKISFKMKDLQWNLETSTQDELKQKLVERLQSDSPILSQHLRQIEPTLYNTYERRYFLSACGAFRITLDYNMRFFDPGFDDYRKSMRSLGSETVVELKYETQHDTEARLLTQEFAFRLSKSSKYVKGIDLIRS